MKFPNVEVLAIVEVGGIEELWHLPDVEEEVPTFPKLVHLELRKLPELRNIWRSKNMIIQRSFQNLKILDVRDCAGLEMLCPLSMAATLEQLDILCAINNKNMKEVIAKETEEMNSSDIEMTIFSKLQYICLSSLPNLKCFFRGSIKFVFPSLKRIDCIDLKEMVAFISSESPEDSNAVFNNKVVMPAIKDISFGRVYGVQEIWGSHLDVRSFNGLETINISFAEKVKKVFSLDTIKQMQNLKKLNLQNFQSGEEFIELTGCYNDEIENSLLLPQLRNLVMESFPQLKWIPWTALTLENLCTLKISEIHGLTSLFPASICRRLGNLKKLDVSHCQKMEVIVGGDSGNTNAVEVKVVFPHLNFLRLSNLPMFRSLGSYNVVLEFPSIEQVDFDECQNPTLLHDSLFDKFQHVKELQLGGCEALLELLNLEGRASAIPPQLRKLTLHDMPNLQRIPWMVFPIGNLRYLKITDIDRLKSLFPTFLCNKGFVHLEEIHIDKCNNIERVLAQESSEDTSPTTIIFPRVKLIKLQHLSNLRSFGSENYHTIKFPSLEKVTIEKCQRMKTFSYGSLSTPRLHKIKISCKDEKECFNLNTVIKKRIKGETSG